MTKISAGILAAAVDDSKVKILLVHPGGPFFKNKDKGAWSIPKGELETSEELLDRAKLEFTEETGIQLLQEDSYFLPLGSVKQKSGKVVHAWAVLIQYIKPEDMRSNVFEMEWPKGSGNKQSFPEVDKHQWFTLDEAKTKINQAQIEFINRLVG